MTQFHREAGAELNKRPASPRRSYRDSLPYLRSDRVVFGEKVWPLKFSRQEKAS